MRMKNKAGEVIYYNPVTKRGRDGQKLKSRTFTQEHHALAWLERNGYEMDFSPWE